IRKTVKVLEDALAGAGLAPKPAAKPAIQPLAADARPGLLPTEKGPTAPATSTPATPAAKAGPHFLVAVTSCPTGIAHTFMAAKALEKGAAALGDRIRVETQGSVGAKSVLTDEEIRNAAAVVIAADTHVDPARLAGQRLLRLTLKAAPDDGGKPIEQALVL